MKTLVICREVRSEVLNDHARLIIIATQDDAESTRSIDLTDLSQLSEVKAKLESHEFVLGGSPLGGKPHAQRTLPSSIELTANDELGGQHLLIADSWEEYKLSSGSTLYYFYIADAPADYHWLVDRRLEICDAQNALDELAGFKQQKK